MRPFGCANTPKVWLFNEVPICSCRKIKTGQVCEQGSRREPGGALHVQSFALKSLLGRESVLTDYRGRDETRGVKTNSFVVKVC